MQAILTKVLPATNTLPTRIKAECARGSLIYSTTHLTFSVGSDEAHRLAAKALCDKFVAEDQKQYGPNSGKPWSAPFVTGTLPNGDKAHCFSNADESVLIEFNDAEDAKNFRSYKRKADESDGTVGGLWAGISCSAIKRAKVS